MLNEVTIIDPHELVRYVLSLFYYYYYYYYYDYTLRTWAGFETCSWAGQLSGLVNNSSSQIFYRFRDDRFLVNERQMRYVGTLGTSNAL